MKNRARELQQTAERQEPSDTSAAAQVEQGTLDAAKSTIEWASQIGKGGYYSYKHQQNRRKVVQSSRQWDVQRKEQGIPEVKPKSSYHSQSLRTNYIQQARKKQIIRQAVNRYFAQNSVSVKSLQQTMPEGEPLPLPGRTWKKQIQHGLVQGFKQIAKKMQHALVTLTRRAVYALIRLLAAGWVVLLLLLVMGAVAALLGSPMGILLADESTDPNAIPIATIVQQTNQEFVDAIHKAIAEYPDADEVDLQYQSPDGKSWADYWPETLALFAVDTNLHSDTDVVVIDQTKKQQIQAMFWEMNQIETHLEQQEIVLPEQDNSQEHPLPSPAVPYKYILHVTISTKSVEEMAEEKNFTQQERELLRQLLSPQMHPALEAMCGDVPPPELE